MKTLWTLTKRNMKIFFKDKGLFFASMIVPLILLLLYVTFLGNVYLSSFRASLPTDFTVDDKILHGLVAGQLFSSLLAVCCLTVAFCANVIMVQDHYLGVRKDLLVTPVKKPVLALSYYLATLAVTLIINFVALGVSLLYTTVGWYLSFGDVCLIVADVFLFSMFGTALSSIINYFLRTQGQVSAVSTIVSSCYGFICGAYMPISQFSSSLQTILRFLPSTYTTALIKNHAMRGAFDALENSGLPARAVTQIKQSIDCQFTCFGYDVSTLTMFLVVLLTVLVLVGIYILINVLHRNKPVKKGC